MNNKEPKAPKDWENDFYEIIPIIKSELILDAKVSHIKRIFKKTITAAREEGLKERLAELPKWTDEMMIKISDAEKSARTELLQEITGWTQNHIKANRGDDEYYCNALKLLAYLKSLESK